MSASGFWHSDVWIAVGSLAQIGIVLSVPTSIWLAYIGEKRARELAQQDDRRDKEQFQREERDKFYAQLDATYLKILNMIVANPKLADADLARSREEEIQYDAFAFIMWNFIESIYDFCLDDSTLKETWHCILECESAAHSAWFAREENRRKFKKKFCDYVDSISPPNRAGVVGAIAHANS
ncbi:MAG TPA: hypothetical protein VH331_14250 [Allosphingosinicella sp.]|jgi:hypothetical protein|nr:hypothetical protein [Allosphingosinicella sp.]